jgi:2-keto-4-pentenoate hydratase
VHPIDEQEQALADSLATARAEGTLLALPPAECIPRELEAAYRVQQAFLAAVGGGIGGWKVGGKAPTGPAQGAPLPEVGVQRGSGTVPRRLHPVLGVELEIAFRLNRAFAPGAGAYESEEILASIAEVGAAVEIVSSRFAQWPDIDRLLQLADLQNHGALVVGEMVAYRSDLDYLAPLVHLSFAERPVFDAHGSNPAGDPRHLLPWLVNHCCTRGLTLTPHMIITTGTYTGLLRPEGSGVLAGKIAGLPVVQLSIE